MLAFIHHLLSPIVHSLKGFERKGRIYLYGTKKRYPLSSRVIGSYFTLGKLVLYALIAVSLCYALDITVSKEILNFFKRDLFFTPLGWIVPFLLATAMFAVPQRIPFETLATIGVSVIATYLVTTLFSSSLGYGSVVLFDTAQYIKPLLTEAITGEAKEFSTDFTLLYIIGGSLLLSFIIGYLVKSNHQLHSQIVFLSLSIEKIAYMSLAAVLLMMPLAVFASILDALQTNGLEKMSSLGWFTLFVNIPQIVYLFVLVLVIRWGTKVSFGFALGAVKKLAKVAIPSGSSAATILTNVETARTFPIKEKYKNKGLIASILPFGATVNMDGTALFITIMCKIGADIQGIDVSFWEIIPYAVAYSCAAAAVPSASIVLITAIYSLIGIDPSITVQILGLMIAVDWINDRMRTFVNVSGDLTAILLSLNERSPLQLLMKAIRFKRD